MLQRGPGPGDPELRALPGLFNKPGLSSPTASLCISVDPGGGTEKQIKAEPPPPLSLHPRVCERPSLTMSHGLVKPTGQPPPRGHLSTSEPHGGPVPPSLEGGTYQTASPHRKFTSTALPAPGTQRSKLHRADAEVMFAERGEDESGHLP